MKPFLRWAGGKHSQLALILHLLPKGNRLVEPFVGAGSVFMNAGFAQNSINDVNPDLINLYNVLNHQGQRLLDEAEQLHQWVTNEENYYRVQDRLNATGYTAYSRAAFFLVLNRTCFNGLCRYNQQGLFNVPWGKKAKPYFPRAELEAYLESGLNPTTWNLDFTEHMAMAQEGDVIFCDPPYEPMPGKKGFTTYSGTTFDFSAQRRVVDAALKARAKGVPTVITNSSAPKILDLYEKAGFTLTELPARRAISAKSDSRENLNDIIAVLK